MRARVSLDRVRPEQAEQAQQLYDSGTSVPKIAQTFKIGRFTIDGYITLKPAK
ncbi:helix-turn-helix domain-containing protein [Streptomyces sp. NPDC006510]|uniref:helix-turn-helix domain-containing protein n=1 Tax=Streptomyces sp. NPDC006510 TaxID=3155600 RepID=UPI0033AE927E